MTDSMNMQGTSTVVAMTAPGTTPGGTTVFPFSRTLLQPVEWNGGTISEVTLRKPKGRDFARWQGEKDKMKRNMGLLVDLAAQPREVFDEMDYEDHAVFLQVADGFFAHYRPEENGFVEKLMSSPSFMDGLRPTSPS